MSARSSTWMRRIRLAASMVAIGVTCVVPLARTADAKRSPKESRSERDANATDPGGELRGSDETRLREGTQLTNQLGRFRAKSEMATLVLSEEIELGVLPNLNLQRVMRMLKTVDEPESILWSVSGTITEFNGRNYLLVTRATYKSAAPPPPPEQLETAPPTVK